MAHALWDSSAPRVKPGDRLMMEWNEFHTMGLDATQAQYAALPAGQYRFRVAEVSPLGAPGPGPKHRWPCAWRSRSGS